MKNILIVVFIFTIILGLRFYLHYQSKKEYIAGQEISLSHTFFTEPKLVRGQQFLMIEGISIYLPRYPRYQFGDSVDISGRIERQEYVSKKSGELISSWVLKDPLVKDQAQTAILKPLIPVRSRIITTFEKYLPRNAAGLLLGIVLGVREGLDQSFYDQLKVTGVVHIVAASGSNVSMVAAFLSSLLGLIVKRKLSIIFTILGICIYALLSGFDPPIVRASIMAGFALVASLFGRPNYTLLALFLSGFLMLMFQPILSQNVGFQLSFLSTFGIITLKPIFDNLFGKKKFIILEDLSTTLAAQITTLPILLTVFSSYSPVSVLVNLLVLWTIPIIMLLGGVAALLSLALPILAMPILYLCWPLLVYFKAVIELFDSYASLLTIQHLPSISLFGIYLIIGAFIVKFRKRSQVSEATD